jgi:hypothetical protein
MNLNYQANKSKQYFYKLGHCQPLALAEFASITGSDDFQSSNGFLLSSKFVDVKKTGSLIFSGEVLASVSSFDFFKNNPLMDLESVFESKKLGLAILSKKNLKDNLIFKTLKSQGYKKINLLRNKIPTIGNFLSTKNWLILFEFQESLILAKITNFFDQEFWSDLDMSLPIRDLKRGQINLKLARSLANLTTNEVFWDPFCGISRNLISAIDLKTDFLASDIDKVALSQAKQNYKFAVDFFAKRSFVNVKRKPIFFSKDISKSFSKLDIKLPKTVVTEGFLGQTFQSPPSLHEINQELEKVRKIWSGALFNFKELGIQEIIFCLPFYVHQKKLILPDFIDSLAAIFNYKQEFFYPDQNKILYKRKASNTGHWVIKLVVA